MAAATNEDMTVADVGLKIQDDAPQLFLKRAETVARKGHVCHTVNDIWEGKGLGVSWAQAPVRFDPCAKHQYKQDFGNKNVLSTTSNWIEQQHCRCAQRSWSEAGHHRQVFCSSMPPWAKD
jgi:hypothetical protein